MNHQHSLLHGKHALSSNLVYFQNMASVGDACLKTRYMGSNVCNVFCLKLWDHKGKAFRFHCSKFEQPVAKHFKSVHLSMNETMNQLWGFLQDPCAPNSNAFVDISVYLNEGICKQKPQQYQSWNQCLLTAPYLQYNLSQQLVALSTDCSIVLLLFF